MEKSRAAVLDVALGISLTAVLIAFDCSKTCAAVLAVAEFVLLGTIAFYWWKILFRLAQKVRERFLTTAFDCWKRFIPVMRFFGFGALWFLVWTIIGTVLFRYSLAFIKVLAGWFCNDILCVTADPAVWLIIKLLLLIVWGWFSIAHCLSTFPRWPQKKSDENVLPLDTLVTDDHPIQNAKEDLLERTAFIEALREKLLTLCGRDSASYIGLYGSWGEGKTSAYNMLKQAADGSPLTFVEFSPWNQAAASDFATAMFPSIADKIRANAPSTKGLRSLCVFGYLLSARKISAFLSALPDCLSTLKIGAGLCPTVTAIKKSVCQVLREIQGGMHIVVVLDDLDRLPPAEVAAVIRLIRTNGDLPNVSYLLVGDPRHMASAMQQMLTGQDDTAGGNAIGREYLEKIVPVEMWLPRVPVMTYRLWFESALRDAVSRHPDWSSLKCPTEYDLECVYPYLTTPRRVRRVLLEIESALRFHQIADKGEPKVHLGDLAAIVTMSLFEHEFYNRLFTHRNMVLGFDMELHTVLPHERSLKRADVAKVFYPNVEGDARKVFESFFARHLLLEVAAPSAASQPTSDQLQFTGNQMHLQAEFRLAADSCFDKYFVGMGMMSPSIASVRDVERLRDAFDNGEKTLQLLLDHDKRGNLKSLLRLMEEQPPLRDAFCEKNYLSALMRLGDADISDGRGSEIDAMGMGFALDIYTVITRCILFYMERTHYTSEERSRLLSSLLLECASVSILTGLIGREDGRDGCHKGERALFVDNDFYRMRDVLLDRIEALQENGLLAGHSREADIRRGWRIFAKHADQYASGNSANGEQTMGDREKRFCRLIRSDLERYPSVIYTLRPFQARSSVDPVWFAPILCEEFERAFGATGYEVVRRTLVRHESELCEDGRTLIKLIDYHYRPIPTIANIMTPHKTPFSNESMSYLLSA